MAYSRAPAAVTDPYERLFGQAQGVPQAAMATGAHPLYDAQHNARRLEREAEITATFDAIKPALREIAAMQWQEDFAERARYRARAPGRRAKSAAAARGLNRAAQHAQSLC